MNGRLPAPCQAVIFDMDGLLLDTERIYRRALIDAATLMGVELTEALHERFIGLPGAVCDAMLVEHFGPGFAIDDYRRCFTAEAERHLSAGIPVKTGVAELLDFLDAEGIPKAVATSSRRPTVELYLGRTGLLHRFDAIATRSDVACGKPEPDVFLKAAEWLGIPPAACIALEDSFNGIRAAHRAGMAAIMVPDLLRPTEEIRGLCAAVIDDLHAVRDLLLDSRRDSSLRSE